MIIVAYSRNMARHACRRMQLPERSVTLVSTEDVNAGDRLRGLRLDPEAVVLVQDGRFVYSWVAGRYAIEVEDLLRVALAGQGDLSNCLTVVLP